MYKELKKKKVLIIIITSFLVFSLSIVFACAGLQIYQERKALDYKNQEIQFELFKNSDLEIQSIDKKIGLLKKEYRDLDSKFFKYGIDFDSEPMFKIINYNYEKNAVREKLVSLIVKRNQKSRNYNNLSKNFEWDLFLDTSGMPRKKIHDYKLEKKYK